MFARLLLLAGALTLLTGVAQADHPPGPVPPKTASELLGGGNHHPGAVVLDVRTAEEFAAGHLPNAFNVDFYQADFRERLAGLERDVPYLIYCRSGKRSGQAYELMMELGFSQVNDLSGGITAWRKADLPVVR